MAEGNDDNSRPASLSPSNYEAVLSAMNINTPSIISSMSSSNENDNSGGNSTGGSTPTEYVETTDAFHTESDDSTGMPRSSASMERRTQNPYPCHVCGERLSAIGELIEHQRNHREEKPFQCNGCDMKFPKESKLLAHINNNRCGRYLQCPVCTIKFISPSPLKMHMRAHEKKEYQCKDCGAILASQDELESHADDCLGDRQRTLRSRSRLLFNNNDDEGSGSSNSDSPKFPIECWDCPAKFGTERLFKEHLKVHEADEEVQFTCHVCHAILTDPPSLEAHMDLHAQESMPECSVCSKLFESAGELAKHMKTLHKSAVKSLYCEICRKKQRDPVSLATHLEDKHPEVRQRFHCTECGLVFVFEENLELHMENHAASSSKRKIECTVCRKRFKHANMLEKHMETHDESDT